jgi:hypothetical protein
MTQKNKKELVLSLRKKDEMKWSYNHLSAALSIPKSNIQRWISIEKKKGVPNGTPTQKQYQAKLQRTQTSLENLSKEMGSIKDFMTKPKLMLSSFIIGGEFTLGTFIRYCRLI